MVVSCASHSVESTSKPSLVRNMGRFERVRTSVWDKYGIDHLPVFNQELAIANDFS
jgi:hypothetical protein